MKYLAPHRAWLTGIALTALLLLVSTPLLRYASQKADQNLAQTRAACVQTNHELQQLKDDIAAVKKLSGEITLAEAEQWLTPVDRLRAATLLEQRADASHFSDFNYNLSPEQNITINTPGAGAQQLAISTITLTGEAGLDTDVYKFINTLHQFLPGRLRLQQMSLERLHMENPGAANLKFNATLEWLSNGATKDMAGAP